MWRSRGLITFGLFIFWSLLGGYCRTGDFGLFIIIIIIISTDIPDPLSPPLPIVHCFRQVLRATSCIGTELLYVCSSRLSYLCMSIWRGPQEYITYELVPTSPAASHMSGSSNFDSLHDGWSVAVQLLLCRGLSPGLVQYCSQHSCVVDVKFFLHPFC